MSGGDRRTPERSHDVGRELTSGRPERLPIVCVFAKPPRPGQVKTRLAHALGEREAADLARAFLADTCGALRALPVRTVLATTELWAADEFAPELWLQGAGTLGERLERILRRALQEAPWAMALGADSPGFPPGLVESAQRALESVDVVFGPADDGGFYFVAARACPAGAFAGVPWSAADTLHQAELRLGALGVSSTRSERWFDVDTLADLRRLQGLLDDRRVSAPATAHVISTIPALRGEAGRGAASTRQRATRDVNPEPSERARRP